MDGVRGTPQEAHFFLAVCSLEDKPPSPSFLFVHQGSNVLREREKHIEILQRELSDAHEQFAALLRAHDELTVHTEEQTRWALRTDEELEAVRRDLIDRARKADRCGGDGGRANALGAADGGTGGSETSRPGSISGALRAGPSWAAS